MSKSKYVLFLLHLPPPVHGSSTVGLAIKNSKTINNSFKTKYINLLASKKISETGKVSLLKTISFIRTWFRLLIEIIKEKPDICYFALTTTGIAFYKDVFLIALVKIFKIKRIYHLHNKGISKYQDKFINRSCYNFVLKNADVILLSKRLYTDIQLFVPNSKVHVCPNGISAEVDNPPLITSAATGENSSYETITNLEGQTKNENKIVQILFLSNLNESKGVYVLLEACSLLKSKEIPFKCIFIGSEGDVTRTLFNQRAQQLNLGNQATYQGEKYGVEKIKAIEEADIFAFPTYYEVFGLVTLEVMQQSKPVVSTFEGSIPDIVEDGVTGFLVPQRDAKALSEKLQLLINNSHLRQQMGAAGRRKYEKEFTFEIFENTLKNILLQVIEK